VGEAKYQNEQKGLIRIDQFLSILLSNISHYYATTCFLVFSVEYSDCEHVGTEEVCCFNINSQL
jgi:hypothetical protein